MTWNLIRLSEAPSSLWRNGGGRTRELAAYPEGQDWTWRISVADVAADGPFSHFDGVQRWFAVLDGTGVRLTVAGREHEMTPESSPLEFDGGVTADCRLLGGATQDLNLMVRRRDATASMLRLAGPRRFATGAAGFVALYCVNGLARVRHGHDSLDLPAESLAWRFLPAGSEVEVTASAAIWMEIKSSC
jgi:environmental stress-induced protein Ves